MGNISMKWKEVNPAYRSKVLLRAENLAAVLNLSKDKPFQSLSCKGLLVDDQNIGFVVNLPSPGRIPKETKSLLDLFSTKGGLEPPSLSD